MSKKILILLLVMIGLITVLSVSHVRSKTDESEETNEIVLGEGYEDWSEETHSNDADTDYDTVFPQDEVNRLDIVINEDDWQTMLDNMEEFYGGSSERDITEEDLDKGMPGQKGGGAGGGGLSGTDENPVFVESQIFFNDTQWYNVGIRFKGNSSLQSAWSSGTLKLPFKIDFDQFEDDYPELEDQRFYGFKQLSLSSGYSDSSLLHEKLAAEAFDAAGVAAPETAFYELYIDYGEGPTYFGLYTAVEVVDDTVIDSDFDDNDGNLYKAEGSAASFAANTAGSLEEGFDKKTNEEEDEWSDLEELSKVINSDTRLTDYTTWKSDLEEIFDTDAFLNWLAVNTVIQNWDTYGAMTHNYYLYNNPDTGQLTWIPWDNNESFSDGKRSTVTLTFNEVSESWPLIRYLIDDEEYRATYLSYVDDFLENVLDTDEFKERVAYLHDLIEPYVIGDEGEQEGYTLLKSESAFTNSITELLAYIEERIALASEISLDSNWEYTGTGEAFNEGGMRPMEPAMGEQMEGMEPPTGRPMR